jgi:hypothetical protein
MHALFKSTLPILTAALTLCAGTLPSRAQEEEGEVLTRGPVHEAFAEVVEFNPEPGPVIAKAPPETVQELPPDQKPEGEQVEWIPGYWVWDEDKNDYIWVSGIWRVIPPGRQWVPGYWTASGNGWRRTAGYWGHAGTKPAYLPTAPPAHLESGPNTPAPSEDHIWVSGTWVYQDRYVWRPGYWEPARAEWTWIPPHYVWTPHGYLFVDGYWDYEVDNRGVIFAPVYFPTRVVVRHYSPTIVINLSIFNDCLFVRHRRHHYYFGDYFAVHYHNVGFYAAFSAHSHRRCYDPIFVHRRWHHRHDSGWERRLADSYRERRENPAARPPRTFAESQRRRDNSPGTQTAAPIAATLTQVATRPQNGGNFGSNRFRRLEDTERRDIAQQRYGNGRSRNGTQRSSETPVVQAATQNRNPARPQGAAQNSQTFRPQQPADSRRAPQLPAIQSPGQTPAPEQVKMPEEQPQVQTGPNSTRPPGSTRNDLPQTRVRPQAPNAPATQTPDSAPQTQPQQERSRRQQWDAHGYRSTETRRNQAFTHTPPQQNRIDPQPAAPRFTQPQTPRREDTPQSFSRPQQNPRQETAPRRQAAPQTPATAPVEVRQNPAPSQTAQESVPERSRYFQNNRQQIYFPNSQTLRNQSQRQIQPQRQSQNPRQNRPSPQQAEQ